MSRDPEVPENCQPGAGETEEGAWEGGGGRGRGEPLVLVAPIEGM